MRTTASPVAQVEAGGTGELVAEVAAERDVADVRVLVAEAAHGSQRTVGAAVVDEDDLVVVGCAGPRPGRAARGGG